MDMKKLKKSLMKIEMSQEIQDRIIKNCSSKKLFDMEEYTVNNSKKTWLKKSIPMVAALSVFFCFAIVGVAAAGSGFFKDVTRWSGAVVGTAYEQASGEIEAKAAACENVLTVSVTVLAPDKVPYSEFEELGISSYQIIDTSGNVIVEEAGTELSQLSNGQAEINIPLDGIESGSYKLIIRKYVGSAKADQPLEISGMWECEFEN